MDLRSEMSIFSEDAYQVCSHYAVTRTDHPSVSRCVVRVASEDEAAAGTKRGNGVAALQAIRLRLQPVWPLSLVVQEAHMEQYNDILAFLLQVTFQCCEGGSEVCE